LNLFVG